MSRDNLEVARQVLDAVSRQDLARLIELTDPEIEWQSFFAIHGEAYHGHDGLRQYVRDLNDAFEDLRPHADDLLDAGEIVLAIGSVHYRGKESGVETDSDAGWMFRFRDGKMLVFRAFSEPLQKLEGVGL